MQGKEDDFIILRDKFDWDISEFNIYSRPHVFAQTFIDALELYRKDSEEKQLAID